MSASAAQTSSSPSESCANPESRNPQHGREYEHELLYSEVVEHLRSIISSLGVTQHELAERLQVSDARISRIMTGRENLTLRTLADLGWAVGMRFEVTATPLAGRDRGPARDDPPPPRWLIDHAALVARRVAECFVGVAPN